VRPDGHSAGSHVQLALLLKTIPCLEQLDKTVGARLLEGIQAEHILVSFPAQSLGGRGKGMLENYEAHFLQLVAGKNWAFRKYEFSTELAFLLSRT
jgi:16S rRNA (guanine(1405)-N(7))-methyltransferase